MDRCRGAVEYIFGKYAAPPKAVVSCGTVPRETQLEIIAEFGDVLHHRDDVVQYYLVDTKSGPCTFVYNVVGGACIFDVLALMGMAGVEEFFFFSFAGSAHNLTVGTIVLPDRVVNRDGISNMMPGSSDTYTVRDELRDAIFSRLKHSSLELLSGTVLSVPCVFHLNPELRALSKREDTIAFEMELSAALTACLCFSLRCHPILIISDNAGRTIFESITCRTPYLQEAMRAIKPYFVSSVEEHLDGS